MPMQTETRSPETLGPYSLIREIGRGGNSMVHQAVDRRTGKTVALKVHTIPPSLSTGERQELLVRFAREARAMARLSHPDIVAIHEVGEQDGMHFLAMEYLEGQTLRDRLKAGPLTPAQAAPILAQVAEAVDAVHAAGIVHRDIKPGNVMLLPEGQVKLLDFGVARQSEDTTVTATHSIVGSPAYMAPEQVRGELGDPASDIWALGVLLHEALAGRPPFEAASIPSVLFKVVHETPTPVPHVTAQVQRVLHRALEKDPQRRYPTARALADALQTAVQTSPQTAWAARARRWAAWAALLLLGATLGVVVSVGYRHTPAPAQSAPPLRPQAPAVPTETPQAALPAAPVTRRTPHRRHHLHPGRTVRVSKPARVAPAVPAHPSPRPSSGRRLTPTAARPAARTHRLRKTAPRPPRRRLAPPAFTPIAHDSPEPVRPPSAPARRDPDPPGTPVDAHPVPLPARASRSQPARPEKRPDERKLQNLEKFIWSEGR